MTTSTRPVSVTCPNCGATVSAEYFEAYGACVECGHVFANYTVTRARLTVSTGNIKVGSIANISKLPGNGFFPSTTSTNYICNVSGSCAENCPDCYACRTLTRNVKEPIEAWAGNTLLARDITAYRAAIAEWFSDNPMPRGVHGMPFRVHVAGELESVAELEMWRAVAADEAYKAGYCVFLYTSRFDIALEDYHKNGKPAALIINLSETRERKAPAELIAAGYGRFIIDEGQEFEPGTVHCPAVKAPTMPGKKGEHNGAVTCMKCGRCWQPGSVSAVYLH